MEIHRNTSPNNTHGRYTLFLKDLISIWVLFTPYLHIFIKSRSTITIYNFTKHDGCGLQLLLRFISELCRKWKVIHGQKSDELEAAIRDKLYWALFKKIVFQKTMRTEICRFSFEICFTSIRGFCTSPKRLSASASSPLVTTKM